MTRKLFCITLALVATTFCFAQRPGWHQLDVQKDSVFGISSERAFLELLKNKKATTVIVGIIDTGVDTLHEDLKTVLWTDAKTGSHGWNYIGAETGREDITLLATDKQDFYDSLAFTAVPESFRAGYQAHRKLMPQLEFKISAMKDRVADLAMVESVTDSILRKMGKEQPTPGDFSNYQAGSENQKAIISRIIKRRALYPDWTTYRFAEITHPLELARFHLAHGLNPGNTEPDTAMGDADISPDKIGPVKDASLIPYHGTHVAGIIGAARNNGIGMNGVADHVQILMIKANGAIRELRDASLAKGIRFAVDHGAKVINLSFGKPYTWDKKAVDDAVKYAMEKDVLLIHAAGNAGEDIDKEEHYPNPVYADSSGKAAAWIEVGASGPKDDSTLAASFSNYGKRDVDVFAPGVQIYSTLPYNQYQSWDGTSMATPVVTGLAALIREYYPKLTAVQVKAIIMQSVVKRPVLADKCVSGGVINAYNALQLAATYK